jgi:hypothetical protein
MLAAVESSIVYVSFSPFSRCSFVISAGWVKGSELMSLALLKLSRRPLGSDVEVGELVGESEFAESIAVPVSSSD